MNSKAIKESHWYAMRADSNQLLNPQLEENITEIKWVGIDAIPTLLTNSFYNIETIIGEYLSKFSESEIG